MYNRTFVVSKPKYLSRCSTHVVNAVFKRLNDEQREAVVRIGFRSMPELRTCSLPYDILSWMTDQYNNKRGCFRPHRKDIQVTTEDEHRILGLPIGRMDIESLLVRGGPNERLENEQNLMIEKDKMISNIQLKTISSEVYIVPYYKVSVPILCDSKKLGQLNWSKCVADFLENGIKLRNTGDPASISGCMELGLYSGVDVDMVDAFGPRKDAAKLEALRSGLDIFGADVIEVKGELKSLRESKFFDLRLEVDLPKRWPKNVQPLVDDELNGPTVAKLVIQISVPSRLAEDLDGPIVAKDVPMNDKNEDTISDQQINEGYDIAGCNKICAERVLSDEKVAQCVDRLPRRSTRNRKPIARIIKGGRLARMPRREVAKNLGKFIINKQMRSLKPIEWVDGEICTLIHWDKDHWLMFIVDILRYNITILDSLRSCMVGKKFLVNEVRLDHHKALQHCFKNKYKLDIFL
ncbi:hypothetical protein M9H77_12928 [Catharanthus roseus]|uniref:Uncharacterized protein n=1 Tax=Catharanthus roseus TaxID=4058 RepID=A0ACC0BIY6_CATRO|nr:hypothetical protein M9H77_12928 [Catharanthus roseus]